ncbi:MAG: esterase [Bacilli bacterium]|nr:esterase [Bacilli bacterium]
MEIKQTTWYSERLNREMTVKVYGPSGAPILCFPCQDGDANNYEGYGMIDTLAPFIEGGYVKLFCIDGDDLHSYSDKGGDKGHRSWMLEQYYEYVIKEVLPYIYNDCGGFILPYTFGCSLGADHATNMFFRRPDLFAGTLSLSGCWDSRYLFDGWCDTNLYNNCPMLFLKNMPNDHFYIDIYNKRKMILCVGQGPWEIYGVENLKTLKDIFEEKGINAWVDFWGFDSAHDWDWWKKQVLYFLPKLLND